MMRLQNFAFFYGLFTSDGFPESYNQLRNSQHESIDMVGLWDCPPTEPAHPAGAASGRARRGNGARSGWGIRHRRFEGLQASNGPPSQPRSGGPVPAVER